MTTKFEQNPRIAASILDELHDLIDCIDQDMTIAGMDKVRISEGNTLGQSLLEFMQYHAAQQLHRHIGPDRICAKCGKDVTHPYHSRR